MVGIHWLGVFYRVGFGVSKNMEKSVEYLEKSAKLGNCQSCLQLATIHTQEEGFKDPKKAYYYLEKAVLNGVSNFDDLNHVFKENFELLAPVFLKNKSPSALVNKDDKT